MMIALIVKKRRVKKMNRVYVYILLLLSLSSVFTYGFVRPEEYKGVAIKFYDESTDKQRIYDILDMIPEEYLEDVVLIKIQKEHSSKKYCGYYQNVGMITIFCYNLDTFLHELAHLKDMSNHNWWWYGEMHGDNWCNIYKDYRNNTIGYMSNSYRRYCEE